ncbi:MAG: hypothetical protein AAF226_12240, partial [Verrucomicrobiota bacterium]
YACKWHTDQTHCSDITIGACWDSDRLDLGRVGLIPDSRYLNTILAKEIADYGSIFPWFHLCENLLDDPMNHHMKYSS